MSARAPCVIGLAALALAALPPACRAGSLYDSLMLAYQTNPSLRAQRAELQALGEGYVQARAGLGPQVNLTAQGEYDVSRVQGGQSLFTPPTDHTFHASTGSGDLSLVQPLYASGGLRAQTRSAAASVSAGREALRQAESQLLQNVITAYVDVRRDRDTVGILRDEIASLSRAFEETKAKGGLGQLTRTDVAESEARLLSARAQLNLAQGRLNASNAEYLNVVGESPGDLDPEPELLGAPASVDQAFDVAERENPQLRGAVETERAARERVNQAKAAFGPTVSLKVDASATPVVPYLHDQYARGLTGAVLISQPIFTSGLTSSRVREAVDRDAEAELGVEFTRRGVVRQIAQAWSQLASTQSALAIESRQVEVERIAVEGNEVEERVGLRTTIELLNAELELANSRVDLIQTRRDAYVARAALLAAMGRLEIRQLVPGAKTYDPEPELARARRIGAVPWEGGVSALDGIAGPGAREQRLSPPGAGGRRPTDLPPVEGAAP